MATAIPATVQMPMTVLPAPQECSQCLTAHALLAALEDFMLIVRVPVLNVIFLVMDAALLVTLTPVPLVLLLISKKEGCALKLAPLATLAIQSLVIVRPVLRNVTAVTPMALVLPVILATSI